MRFKAILTITLDIKLTSNKYYKAFNEVDKLEYEFNILLKEYLNQEHPELLDKIRFRRVIYQDTTKL